MFTLSDSRLSNQKSKGLSATLFLPGTGTEGAEKSTVDVQYLARNEIGGRGGQVNGRVANVFRFTPSGPGRFPLDPFVK